MTLGAITALLQMRWAQSPRSSCSFRPVSSDSVIDGALLFCICLCQYIFSMIDIWRVIDYRKMCTFFYKCLVHWCLEITNKQSVVKVNITVAHKLNCEQRSRLFMASGFRNRFFNLIQNTLDQNVYHNVRLHRAVFVWMDDTFRWNGNVTNIQ